MLTKGLGCLGYPVPSSGAESLGAKYFGGMTPQEKMRLFALERFVGSSLPRVGSSGTGRACSLHGLHVHGFGSQRTPSALLGSQIWGGHAWAWSLSPSLARALASMGIGKGEPGRCPFPCTVPFSGGIFSNL